MKISEQTRAIFQIGHKLDLSVLHQIRQQPRVLARKVGYGLVGTGTQCANGERTDTVGTTRIKTLAENGHIAVAKGMDDTGMPHHTRVGAERPGFGEVGFGPDKLRIRILEHFLMLLFPAVARNDVAQRNQVACLRQGGFPAYGVGCACRTGVGVGIAHFGHEIVAHHGAHVGIVDDQRVEFLRVAVHKLILHGKRTELVAAARRGLPAIGPVARHHVHLVVARTTDDVGGNLGQRRGRSVEPATTATTVVGCACSRCLLTARWAAHTVATKEGCDDTRKLQRGIGTILVGVHAGAVFARLPLVRAVQVDVELFSTPEGIALGEAKAQLGSHAPDGAVHEIGLNVGVVGLIEYAVDIEVERVAGGRGVAGRKAEIHHAEQSHGIDFTDCFHVVVVTEQLPAAQPHAAQDDARTQLGLVARIAYRQRSAHQTVGGLFHERLAYIETNATYVPLASGFGRNCVSQLQPQLCMARHLQRVRKVRGIARLEIIISVVAQKGAQPRTFGVEPSHSERVALANHGLVGCGCYQAVGCGRKSHIAHAVNHKQWSHVHSIANLALLRIFLRHGSVIYFSVEIAVILEHRLCHRGAQSRIHHTHQHGRLAKRFGHPFSESRFRLAVSIPYPQTIREWSAVVAAAKQCTVGRGGQGGVDFLASGHEVVVLLVVLVVNLGESDEELVVVGNIRCGGTARQHEQAQ